MKDIHIVLFFSTNMSLKNWHESGSFSRETALYKRLIESGIKVSFVTYGDETDLDFADKIPGINICCNKWNLPRKYYFRLLPFLHWKTFRSCDLIKTNQTDGATMALAVAQKYKKPLVSRSGYLLSDFRMRRFGVNSPEHIEALKVESEVFTNADKIIVTTPIMSEDIIKRFPETRDKITILPNYVDMEVFKPDTSMRKDIDLVFVGRIAVEKNIDSILQAVNSLEDLSFVIIGDGPLKDTLQKEFANLSDRVKWIKKVDNNQIPEYINRSKLFILASFHEGHPKTILEAMACEAAVIGANSPGINDTIKNGENGLLCETDPESIRNAIESLLVDEELRRKLGRNARQYIVDNMSLDKIVEMELEVYNKCLE